VGIHTILFAKRTCLSKSDQFESAAEYIELELLPYPEILVLSELVELVLPDIFHLNRFELRLVKSLAVRSDPKNWAFDDL